MRIIAGTHRGTRLQEPAHITRPTSDRVREAIFNVLRHVIEDATVLDLFSGTGALGLEALSRGAQSCTFVDSHPLALNCLRKNIAHTKFSGAKLVDKDALSFCFTQKGRTEFSLIFADPPYCRDGSPDLAEPLLEPGCLPLASEGIFVLEVEAERETPRLDHLDLLKRKNYGKTSILYFQNPA